MQFEQIDQPFEGSNIRLHKIKWENEIHRRLSDSMRFYADDVQYMEMRCNVNKQNGALLQTKKSLKMSEWWLNLILVFSDSL